jgi:predicted alpha/beta superfamily hydrolase
MYRRHRTRDYTPTHTLRGGYGEAFQRFCGGGPAFLELLDERFLPFVDERYRTNGERALVGHSYGGLFVTWVLLTHPDSFDRYLAVSPSYWYDDRVVFRMEEKVATPRPDLRARVFLTAGALENPPRTRFALADDLEAFAEKLSGRGYPGLELEMRLFPRR